MRKIFIILLLFVSLFVKGQSETNDFITYDTTVTFTPGPHSWYLRITRPANMFTANHPDTASRPVIIVMHGQGQAGSTKQMASYGPHYWLNNGWDGSITTGNGTHYPIIITVQPINYSTVNPYINPRGPQFDQVINHILNTYHIKRNSVHVMGFSMGAFTWGKYIVYEASAGAETGMKNITSAIFLQGTSNETFAPYNAWSLGYAAYGHWAAKYGGKFFGLEGTNDTRTVWRSSENMNDSVSGSAYFAYENIGGGTHCCWNDMYDPSRRNWKNTQNDLGTNIVWNTTHPNTMGTYQNGWNVYEWAFRQGDTTLVGTGNVPPSVDAGSNQTITLPTSTVSLNAAATDSDGSIVSYLWEQISGPSTATIVSDNTEDTDIEDLEEGTYIFRLTVTDNDDGSSSDQVTITVNPDPTTYPSPSGKKIVGPGEYQSYFIRNDGSLWAIGNITNIGTNNTGTLGVAYPVQVTSGLKFTVVAGGLHGGAAVDTTGRVWVMGDNDQYQHGIGNNTQPIYTPSQILVDSAGDDFDNVRTVIAYFVKDGGNGYNGFYAIKNDSTLWGWGTMVFGMRGDSTAGAIKSRPVQIVMPGNRKVVQLVSGQFTIALCSDSTVWVWGQGASNTNIGYSGTTEDKWSPKQLTGLSGITQIAGGMLWNYALASNGVLYGWGSYGERMGNSNGLPISTPTVLSNITNNLPASISKIVTNSAVTHVILSDSTLWGWGDNGQGTVGNGERINFHLDGGNPFDRNNLDVVLPVQIAKGVLFDTIFGGSTYTYHSYARDVNDSLYCWGRGKGAVLANWLRPASSGITATYGNSWDIAYPTPVDPFNISTSYIQTSDYCVKVDGTQSPCSQYSIPANTAPSANAGADQSLNDVTETDLDGTGSTDNVYISRYEWRQLTGPTTAEIDLPASPTPTVRNLADGTYTFELLTEDNGWLTDLDTVQVTINQASNQPPAITSLTSSADTIQLPTSTIKLTTTATDADGTVDEYVYTLQFAPGGSAPVFNTPLLDTCTITGLTASGTYIFRVTITDDQGAIDFEDISIVVLPASSSGAAMKYRVNIYGGSNGIQTDNWNNWNTSSSINNIIDTTGAETNINVSMSSQLSVLTNTLTTGVMCPDTVLLHTSYSTGARTITITNLESDALYSIEFYCSRTSGNSYTTIEQAGNSKNVLVLNNTSNTIEFTDMTPVSNQIAFNLSGAPHYVNGFTLTRQGESTPVNANPVANAGADSVIILPTSTVNLIGSGSTDSDGSIASYLWELISSEYPITISDSSQADVLVSGLSSPGVYTFRLTVTDDQGATSEDNVSVYVLPEILRWYRIKGTKVRWRFN